METGLVLRGEKAEEESLPPSRRTAEDFFMYHYNEEVAALTEVRMVCIGATRVRRPMAFRKKNIDRDCGGLQNNLFG